MDELFVIKRCWVWHELSQIPSLSILEQLVNTEKVNKQISGMELQMMSIVAADAIVL